MNKAAKAVVIATGKGTAGGAGGAFTLTSAETQAIKGLAKYLINQQKSKTLSGASATEPD